MFSSKLHTFITLVFYFGRSTSDLEHCPDFSCELSYPNGTTPESPNAMYYSTFMDQRCFCDEDCWKYNDCCNDAQRSHQLINSSESLEMFCHKITPKLYGVYVIGTCPSTWPDTNTRLLCERRVENRKYQPILDVPVYNLKTMNVYLNIYCAKCHDDDLNTTVLKMNMKCSSSQDCREDFRKNNSYVAGLLEWHLPNDTVIAVIDDDYPVFKQFRKCHRVRAECASDWTDSETSQLCYSTSALYVFNEFDIVYKNIYCAECNYEYIEWLRCYQLIGMHHGGGGTKPQFNWIMDFSLSSKAQCIDCQELYDEFMDKSVSFACGQNYEFIDGKCVLQNLLQHNNASNFSTYSCVKVRIPISEFSSLSNGSVYRNRTDTLYSIDQIELIDNTSYLLCVDDADLRLRASSIREFSATENILSVTFMSISLVCLAIHIVINCLMGQHRKLPGTCLLNLSLALFFGHFLFIVGVNRTENVRICFVIAIFIHFFFLSVFFWMNIMAVDIYRTFTRTYLRSSWNLKTFIYYSTYAWLSPLIIVIASTTIDLVHDSPEIRPRYGNDVCWISNRFALFIFFALPLAIILVANIILFLITAYYIHKTVRLNTNLRKSSERQRFRVYIKLAFVVGVPWIVGFAAVFTDFEPLWYGFIVLNASQGTFIFIIFTFKRSVFNYLYSKITGKLPPETSSSKRTESV